jgi:hypothetical protein
MQLALLKIAALHLLACFEDVEYALSVRLVGGSVVLATVIESIVENQLRGANCSTTDTTIHWT